MNNGIIFIKNDLATVIIKICVFKMNIYIIYTMYSKCYIN